MPLEISSPLRVLVLSTPSTPLPPLLQGSESTDPILPIITPYYTADVPVWHDTIKSSPLGLSEWEKEWRDEVAAGEVVRAVGAWVVVVRKPALADGDGGLVLETVSLIQPITQQAQIRHMLTTISALLAHHTSSSYAPDPNPDPLLLAVAMHQPLSPRLELPDEAWEDLGRECGGWEWVDGEKESGGRNEFGEKTGTARLLEALQANDWTASSSSPSSSSPLSSSSPANSQLETEDPVYTLGSKDPLLGSEHEDGREGGNSNSEDTRGVINEGEGGGGEGEGEGEGEEVENLDMLMSKMLAIRDLGAEMPEAERRRFAARAVKGIMREF